MHVKGYFTQKLKLSSFTYPHVVPKTQYQLYQNCSNPSFFGLRFFSTYYKGNDCKWYNAYVLFNLHVVSKSPAEMSTPIGILLELPCLVKLALRALGHYP